MVFCVNLKRGGEMKFFKALFRKKRTNESYFRYIFGLLHLWTGLLIGLVVILISLTGALYVFANEYDDIENRQYVKAEQASDVMPSLDEAVERFRADFEQDPGGLYIPLDKRKNITLANRGHQDDRVKVYVDRATGDFVGQAGNKSKVFNHAVISLHRWFMFEDMPKGRRWVGISTFVFMFLLISGLVIWFPRNIKTAKNSFKVSIKGSYKKVNRQLHVNLGFYLTLLLVLVALSGTMITFPKVRQYVIKVFVPENPEKKAPTMTKVQHVEIRERYFTADFSFDKMLDIADEVLGYESDRNIYFPTHHFKEFSVLAANPDNFLGGTWADVVTFDLEGNYKTTYFFSDLPFYMQLNQLVKPLHTGEIFGTKTKILYLILALFSAFLPISGFIIWWKKVVKKVG